ncbi:TetR/AcrR family transcriptional regulator [Caballeronia sp. INDeC2]|uniref:TetR/AcrR family transcriptional regulator n=1 Tax=Caballeronia sp. INDeC2 TaxID=2921747 RepID=UPI00202984E6|nr:TetR/AcrR family transcriptional regulator [Caballeronia sp. INDeC2]
MDAIRDAAIAEFASHGLKGASTQSIAERAGLSKAQLHYYIESKEDLYEKILQHVVDEWTRVFSFGDVELGPRRVLSDYVRKKLEFSFEQPLLSRIFANEMMRGAPVLMPMMSRPRTRTAHAVECINNWIEQNLMRPLDPMLLMMNIWSLTQYFADFEYQARYMLRVKEGHALDQSHIIEEVTTFVMHGCGISLTD